MPSDTEIVPNSSGYPPAENTPSFTALASRSSDRLHGVISFHDDATPICGLTQSSSPMPTARSMPRAAAFSRPSVTSRERGFMSGDCVMRPIVPDRATPALAGSDGGGADRHHVRQVGDHLLPGLAGVRRTPDRTVPGAEVDPRLLVVVGAHRV